MKVNVSVVGVPLDIQDDFGIASAKSTAPITKLITAIAEVMIRHPEFQQSPGYLDTWKDTGIELPLSDVPITVEVVLCQNLEDIPILLDSDMQNALGVFATSSGAFDPTRWMSDKFRVIVACNEDVLRKHLADERAQEGDPSSDRYDGVALNGFLNTVTHELAHAVEFIQHGCGLTPEDVDNAVDEGLLDFYLPDVCTGRGIRPEMPTSLTADEACEIMEDRVEEKGSDWLDWALGRIEKGLYTDCLKAYAPKQKRHINDMDGPGI